MTADSLPAFPVIQRALASTTERLARELVAPTATAPDWHSFEWIVARAVATMHGISGLLAHRLRWQGPAGWQAFLAQQLDQSCARHALIERLLARLDATTRERGLPVVPLKGAALLALDLYLPGERPMGDIDLLVRPGDLPATGAALKAAGFEHAFSVERHAVFKPAHASETPARGFGEHVGNPIKIEVHTMIAEALPVNPVDITRFLIPAQLLPGFNAYPDDSALMRHLLLHAAGNMRAHALRFLQIHDVARLAQRFTETGWTRLVDGDTAHESWWMLPPLTLVSNYYPGVIPDRVLQVLRAAAPRTIARLARRPLTEVSWSNLRIHALPGIGWARSPLEALRFATSRAWPTPAARAGLREAVVTMPAMRQVSWYELPHTARILRWVFGRPPRVQTMLALRGALEYDYRDAASCTYSDSNAAAV